LTLAPYNPPGANISPPPMIDGEVDPGPLTQEEYERFRDALPAWKYQLLCMVLKNTGLRLSEVLALQGRHCVVQGPQYYVAIHRSKQRVKDPDYEPMYLRPNVGVQLSNYIKGQGIRSEDPVFQITRRQVHRVFVETGIKVLGRRVNPHVMRHLFARELNDRGAPSLMVSKMLGHSDPKTVLKSYYEVDNHQRQVMGEAIRA